MICVGYVKLSDLDQGVCQRLYGKASPQRQQRASRYLHQEDALRCIVADGLLRYVLRQTLGTDQVELAVTPAGKPYLPGHEDIHFNLSHSGRWVFLAWGDRPVGIDVETVSMNERKEQLARRFFSADEQAYLFTVRGQERALRFFRIWTKKESYLKYLGTGIDRPLDSFSVLEPLSAEFFTQTLEDAVWTLCAEDPECNVMPVTAQMLLSE